MLRSQLSRSEVNREGEHRGEHPLRARCSPSRSPGSPESRSKEYARVGQVHPRTSISAASCGTGTSGGVLCRPTHRDTAGEVSIAVPWRERPPFWTAWPAKPAASEVVAHATLSVSQPERSSSDSCIEAALNTCRSTFAIFGRRAVIVRLATRALKALRASLIALRPRCARLTALTARAATRVMATIDGPQRKWLTMVGGGVNVGSSSSAAVRSPLYIARCGACSNRRFQTTVRSPVLNSLPSLSSSVLMFALHPPTPLRAPALAGEAGVLAHAATAPANLVAGVSPLSR